MVGRRPELPPERSCTYVCMSIVRMSGCVCECVQVCGGGVDCNKMTISTMIHSQTQSLRHGFQAPSPSQYHMITKNSTTETLQHSQFSLHLYPPTHLFQANVLPRLATQDGAHKVAQLACRYKQQEQKFNYTFVHYICALYMCKRPYIYMYACDHVTAY